MWEGILAGLTVIVFLGMLAVILHRGDKIYELKCRIGTLKLDVDYLKTDRDEWQEKKYEADRNSRKLRIELASKDSLISSLTRCARAWQDASVVAWKNCDAMKAEIEKALSKVLE